MRKQVKTIKKLLISINKTKLKPVWLQEPYFTGSTVTRQNSVSQVPDLRLNDFDVEFTITSASSLLISPEATWKMMGPIFISYTPKSGLEIVPQKSDKEKKNGVSNKAAIARMT